MVLLNLFTLLMITITITITIGVLMVMLGRKTPGLNGPLYWATGSFFIAAGLSANFIAEMKGFMVLYLLSGTMNIIGLGLYYSGLLAYHGKNRRFQYIVISTLLYISVGGIFVFFAPNPAGRMIMFSLISLAFSFLLIKEFYKSPSKDYRMPYTIGKVIFIVHGITHIFRIGFIIHGFVSQTGNVPLISAIVIFSSSFTQTLMLFVFIILVSTRLVEKLRNEIHNRNLLLSTVAHDLRGPIGNITEYLRFLNGPNEMPPNERERFLKRIESLSGSTYNLLLNLLHWASSNLNDFTLRQEEVDLSELMESNFEYFFPFAEEKGVQLIRELDVPATITGDRSMLDAIIRNLISNAIKFTPTGGRVTLSTFTGSGFAGISVTDTGPGMDGEILENAIMGKFADSTSGTEGEKGSGLGLRIIYEFTLRNDGNISVTGTRTTGTAFRITFPVQERQA